MVWLFGHFGEEPDNDDDRKKILKRDRFNCQKGITSGGNQQKCNKWAKETSKISEDESSIGLYLGW